MTSTYAVTDNCKRQVGNCRLRDCEAGSNLNRCVAGPSEFDRFRQRRRHRDVLSVRVKIVVTLTLCLLFATSQLEPVAAREGAGSGQPAGQVRKLRMMARVYMACGAYSEARLFAQRALETAETQGASDQELCACRLDLAYLYTEVGQYDEAETQCKQGIELQQKFYPEKHPDVASALRIMSAILREQGRHEDARAVLERAITIIRERPGQEARGMLALEIERARLLFREGALDAAESCYLETLRTIDRTFGPEHAYTAKIRVELAALYVRQRQHHQAERLVNAAIQVQERVYGPDHHFLIPAWLVLARVHQSRGNQTQVREIIEKSLLTAQKKLEPTHPVTRKVISEAKMLGIRSSK